MMETLENIKETSRRYIYAIELTYLSAKLAYCLRKAFPSKETLFPEVNEILQDFYKKLNPIPVILSKNLSTLRYQKYHKYAAKNLKANQK